MKSLLILITAPVATVAATLRPSTVHKLRLLAEIPPMAALLTPDNIVHCLSALFVVISIAGNFVSPSSKLGSLLHWLSGNGPKIQAAIVAAETSVAPAAVAK